MTRARLQQVRPDVQSVIVTLGTQGHANLASLTSEEVKAAEAARLQDHERVKREHGDFTGAVREGTWDDGTQEIPGESLNTIELVKQLERMGFRFADAYRTAIQKDGKNLQKVVAIFSKTAQPTNRATDEAKRLIQDHLTRNWGNVYVWYNPLREVPNMTINCSSGHLRGDGTAPRLELIAMSIGEKQSV